MTPELLILLLLAGAFLWLFSRPKNNQSEEPHNKRVDKVIIKTYTGSQAGATALYQADAAEMASNGYYPTLQTWAAGTYSAGAFLVALLLCFIIIGFLIFIYMLIVKPYGNLSVTYELREATKPCPSCAEQVKAAAAVCRFCGHKFAPAIGWPQISI